MYICLCKSLTDRDIRRSVFQGDVQCMETLRERLGASTCCGSCEMAARLCLDEALAHKRLFAGSSPDGMDCDTAAPDTRGMPDLGDASPA